MSPAATTKACKGPLKGAVRGGGRGALVDLDHPAVVEWLGDKHPAPTWQPLPPERGASKTTTPRPPKAKRAKPAPAKRPRKGPTGRDQGGQSLAALAPPERGPGSTGDLEELAEALRPMVQRFGTETAFAKWLDQLKKIEDIREKRLKNEETVRALIQRDAVKTFGFGYIDRAQKLLLRDAARTIARRLYAMAKAGEPAEEAERTVRDLLGSTLRPMRAAFAKALRNA